MSPVDKFHHALVAKLGDGTFKLTGQFYVGQFGSKEVPVSLIDIDMAEDVNAMPQLVAWTLAQVKP